MLHKFFFFCQRKQRFCNQTSPEAAINDEQDGDEERGYPRGIDDGVSPEMTKPMRRLWVSRKVTFSCDAKSRLESFSIAFYFNFGHSLHWLSFCLFISFMSFWFIYFIHLIFGSFTSFIRFLVIHFTHLIFGYSLHSFDFWLFTLLNWFLVIHFTHLIFGYFWLYSIDFWLFTVFNWFLVIYFIHFVFWLFTSFISFLGI
jgi:hypothetical protein